MLNVWCMPVALAADLRMLRDVPRAIPAATASGDARGLATTAAAAALGEGGVGGGTPDSWSLCHWRWAMCDEQAD